MVEAGRPMKGWIRFPRPMRPFRPITQGLALVLGLGLGAQVPQRPEYETKALVIRHLVNYVTWPQAPTRPLVLGILGTNPFGDHVAQFQSSQGRALRVIQLRSLRGLGDCDAVFICTSEGDRLSDILRVLQGRPILTFGDTPGFAQRGVMVNLVTQDRIVLEINLSSTRAAGLDIRSAVLSRARIVEGP